MKYGLSLILVWGLACGGLNDYPTNPLTPTPAKEARAIATTKAVFEQYFGPLHGVYINIYWMEGPCLIGLEDDFPDRCLSGYFASEWGIYVVKRDHIWHSSLSHELVHYWLWKRTGVADGAHNRKDWWSKVEEAKEAIKDWEL